MSYSYYLLHGLTLKAGFLVLNRLLPGQGSGDVLFWVLLPVMFAATLATSALLFIVIERPMSLTKHTPLRVDASV
jgi:peptidoglycan/LPS O-acetylase OafA/YrhL